MAYTNISGFQYASSASNITVSGNSWSNTANATGAPDGNFASAGMPSARSVTDTLQLTGFGFNLPAVAIVDGIYAEFDRYGSSASTNTISLVSGATTASKAGTDTWPGAVGWFGYGGSSDTWGVTWTPALVNSSAFGMQLSAITTGSGGTANVDAVRITIYWHFPPADVPKRYIYQVTSGGQYLGNLPNVSTDFTFTQDINTAGSQITVKCGISADTAALPNGILFDETGNPVLDETGAMIRDEGTPPIVSQGSGSALIKNGNHVIITEVSYWNPNGKVVFQGTIQHWEADFGGDGGSNDVMLIIYSDGADLDNHLVRGYPYTFTGDVYQQSQNASFSTYNYPNGTFSYIGQTWKVGSGVTNIDALDLVLAGNAQVNVMIYDSVAMTNLLGSTSLTINNPSGAVVNFQFPSPIPVTAGSTYFITVTCPNQANNFYVYYQLGGNVYANGTMYTAVFNGGSGGGTWSAAPQNDMYFVTYAGNGSTTATYSSVEPIANILKPIMNSYIAEGGLVSYTSSTVTPTALSISYNFNVATVYESFGNILSVCPAGYYYYVDLGTNLLTFKPTNTTPDITLIKDYHTDKVTIVATIEQIVNTVYFTGGAPNGGSNLYTFDNDPKSVARYGIHLDRPTDNNVKDGITAHVIGSSAVKTQKDEQYQTVVTLTDRRIDTTSVKPGMSVGFSGYGSFVDSLVLQVVRVNYSPHEVELTLGVLPRRLHMAVEQTVRGFVGLQTVDNPTSPS